MRDRRAIGVRPAAHRRPLHARSFGLARLAILAAALAFAALEIFGGGPPPGLLVAQRYARAWALREYSLLYADLDRRSRASVPLARFVATERHAYAVATVRGVSVGTARATTHGRFTVALRVHTRIFGILAERFTLTMTGPAGAPKVRWDAPARFPGLAVGEELRRVDSGPQRGVLLARDGSPLRGLPSASNVIGTAGRAGGALLVQTLAAGFPASTRVGLDGLELVFQRELGGLPGGALYAGTRLLASASPRAGANVRTSISPTLQALAVKELGTSLGGIVVMAPSTGELLAAAGQPLSELQPPGSTFKIVTLTAVLEAHVATARTVYPYATSTTLDGFTLHNNNGESCGGTLANAFAVSCNSVFAPLGAQLGAGRLIAAAAAFGFNAPSPVSIAAESTIPPAARLTSDLQVGESAIGQDQVLASPLQMARVAATIALVGRRPLPTFAIVAPQRFPRVLPASVARTVRALMADVVAHGTGVAAQIPGVVVAGKTGTAQVASPPACTNTASAGTGASGQSGPTGPTGATSCPTFDNNPYDTDAWFVAFAPEIRPRVVIAVLLPHDGTGAATAAPVARVILAQALASVG